ncbi:hypothetical protein NQ317_019434 [Molorchus minor]|uniref:Uncharacterized protein n=1 Tax=Molorchus minor TaxID=1323400 RepID=A0ABQ9JYZ7_9CUCU|nr:hypothetical protein NQ317_019434 [Molorchus minor]
MRILALPHSNNKDSAIDGGVVRRHIILSRKQSMIRVADGKVNCEVVMSRNTTRSTTRLRRNTTNTSMRQAAWQAAQIEFPRSKSYLAPQF